MSKLSILYVVSLVVLGSLIIAIVYHVPARVGLTEVQSEQLLWTGDQWIAQFDITNNEGRDMTYTVGVSVDGNPYTQKVQIKEGKNFTYIQHIYSDTSEEKQAIFAIYKEGESVPLEEVTYHLRKTEGSRG